MMNLRVLGHDTMHHRFCSGILAAAILAVVGCADRSVRVPDMDRALTLRKAMGGGASAAADTGAAPERAQPTGWSSLRGRVTLQGTPPEPKRLPVGGDDAEVCAPGGKPVLSEQLVVGSGGGIKGVLVFLTTSLPSEEPWTHPNAKPGKPGEFVFDQKECTFLSHVFAMQTGQTLRILNSDPVGHNTKIENTPINRIVASGGEISYVPDEEWKSPTPVSCSIHPWMSAHMLVRDNGYFAVTNEEGEFEIPNLPAGIELEFRIWQEKSKFLDGITVDGQTVKKGRLVVTLGPEGKELDIPIAMDVFE